MEPGPLAATCRGKWVESGGDHPVETRERKSKGGITEGLAAAVTRERGLARGEGQGRKVDVSEGRVQTGNTLYRCWVMDSDSLTFHT